MPFTAKVHGTDTELEATHMWHTCDSCGGGYIGIDGVYARRQVIIAAENAPPRPPDWSAVWAASTLAREAR